MKLIVFGSSGGVGREVVRQALDNGYDVTAFLRTPSKLDADGERLHVIQGDAFDKEAVSAAIEGKDIVISCLGSSKGMKKSTELEEMTKNIVDGMKKHGVKRIVYTASAGIDGEIPGLAGKMIMKTLKNALTDHRNAVDYIEANGLVSTIIRPMGLTDKELTKSYREAETGVPEKSRSISRADVAHFIIKTLSDSTYENKSVAISD